MIGGECECIWINKVYLVYSLLISNADKRLQLLKTFLPADLLKKFY